MDCCSSNNASRTTLEYAPEIDQSAYELASLLTQESEYQEFIRLARLINLDPDVRRISSEIRNHQMFFTDVEGKSIEALQGEMETLPAVQAYRRVEAALKDLLHSVDQVISTAAGVEFAPNVVQSGCG